MKRMTNECNFYDLANVLNLAPAPAAGILFEIFHMCAKCPNFKQIHAYNFEIDLTKGQLISKAIFHGFPNSQKPTIFFTFFALASKRG